MCHIASISLAQIQSNCELKPELKSHYNRDVADLTIKRLFATSSYDTSQINIPKAYQDSIWRGLAAIFNVTSIPERDSVFDIYCIHDVAAESNMLIPHIYLTVDTSFSWTENWFNGNIVTGYNELDDFLSAFNYYLLSSEPDYATVLLYSDSIINSFAVCDSLTTFDGIESAGPIPITIDADRIEYYAEGEFQYFNFIRAWGDCFAGCIYKHKWRFIVNYSNCTVEYLGLETNFDNNLPEPSNCNITTVNDLQITRYAVSVFPNPSDNRISVLGKGINNIKLINGLGQIVYSVKPENELTVININDLNPGIYFLTMKVNGQMINRKFIKK